MKVYANRKPQLGPWGGGSKVLRSINNVLLSAGHELVNDPIDCDAIFVFDVRQNESFFGAQQLLAFNKPIVCRVGDIGTHEKPELTSLLKQTVNRFDHVVFPSYWAHRTLDVECSFHIIENEASPSFTQKQKYVSYPKKFVTHHWSNNPKKGFDFYIELDEKLKDFDMELTFIGRVPDGLTFKNIKHIQPLNEEQLSVELKKYDGYITASKEEAGANHVLEAIAINLPVLYRSGGGSIDEYCNDFGVRFDGIVDFEFALEKYRKSFDSLLESTKTKIFDQDKMGKKYVDIIEKAFEHKHR